MYSCLCEHVSVDKDQTLSQQPSYRVALSRVCGLPGDASVHYCVLALSPW